MSKLEMKSSSEKLSSIHISPGAAKICLQTTWAMFAEPLCKEKQKPTQVLSSACLPGAT